MEDKLSQGHGSSGVSKIDGNPSGDSCSSRLMNNSITVDWMKDFCPDWRHIHGTKNVFQPFLETKISPSVFHSSNSSVSDDLIELKDPLYRSFNSDSENSFSPRVSC